MANYLNEIYILKERLKSYFTTVERLYRRDRRQQNILKAKHSLSQFVNNALKGIIETRGTHVHRTRFSNEELDRLSSQEFLANHGVEELRIIRNLFKLDYGFARRNFKKTIKGNNEQIKKMLDACFDILFEIVANKDGRIRYPKLEKG